MTKTTTRLFVVAVLGLAFAGMSLQSAARQGQTVDPALKRAADARTAARKKADAAEYARYILDDGYFVSPDGVPSAKQERVAALKTGKPNIFEVSDERYRMFGDSAIHSYRTDGPEQGALRLIEVWVKQGGEWKVAAVQNTRITKP